MIAATGRFPTVALICLCLALLSPTVEAILPRGLPLLTGPAWVGWRTETVDASFVQGSPGVAVDSSGFPHIVYSAVCPSGFGGVWYARFDGVFWVKSSVDCDRASQPSVAIDSLDRPHVSYWKASASDLNYASFDGTQWLVEAVDAPGDVGRSSDIKLDAQDRPHIAYRDLTNDDFKYAFKDASGWHKEIIDTDGKFSGWNGLDLGPDGRPHVAYGVPGGAGIQLKYASRSVGGSWSGQIVDSDGGDECAIAVDALGRPHISYLERSNGEYLGYATFDGAQWVLEVVDRDSPTGWYTSIDTDSRNVPHVAYHQIFNRAFTDDPTRGHLKYASKLPTGQWVTEFVDAVGVTGLDTSLAVDGLDRPRMAYLFFRTQPRISGVTPDFDLKFAEPLPAATLGRAGE